MGLGSIVGAVAPAIIGGLFSSAGQRSANEASAESVQAQIDFQRESAQHAYQWATADMKKAGINPMLAYQRGGSSALSGASYTAQNEMAGLAGGIQEGVSSGLALRRQNADIDQIKANVKKIRQDTQKSKTDEKHVEKDIRLKDAQTNVTDMMGAQARLDYDKKQLDLNSARTAAVVAKEDKKFYESKAGKIFRWIDRAGQSINPLTSATRNIR